MRKRIIGVLMVLSVLLEVCFQAYGVSSFKTKDVSGIIYKNIQGKIENIYYADGSRVLISADKLYLYDLAAGNIIAKAPKESLDRPVYRTVANGYVVVGRALKKGNDKSGFTATGASSGYRCIFYDKKLKKTLELDFSKLLDKNSDLVNTSSITFSSDGKSIAYATFSGLYIYNLTQGKRTTVIDLRGRDAKVRCGLSILEQIGFTNGGKSIAFKGQSLDYSPTRKRPSFDTIGMVNIDGSGLFNKEIKGYAAKELTAYPTKLLFAGDFTTAAGKIMVMNSSNHKTTIYKLTTKAEGGSIYGSNSGKYFASSVLDKTGWTIRVYDAGTGKLAVKQWVSNDGQKMYGWRDPVIRVLDDMKTCVVLFGTGYDTVKTKITAFTFK